MKHIKTFGEFLYEGNFENQLFESQLGDAVKNDVIRIFKSNGFEPTIYNDAVSISLDVKENGVYQDVDSLTPQQEKLVDDIRMYGKKTGHIIVLKVAIGYGSGNSLLVRVPGKEARVGKCYHVASKKNVESILKNGMVPMSASDHSMTFGRGLSGQSFTDQLYKAIFAVTAKGSTGKLGRYFAFDNPVVLQINGKGLTWYPDPNLPEELKSVYTFDPITPDRITVL